MQNIFTKILPIITKIFRTFATIYVILATVILVGICFLSPYIYHNQKILYKTQIEEKEDKEIGRFTLALMNIVNAQLSDVRKQLVAQTVVRVSKNMFDTIEHRKMFAILLAIESKYNNMAKSSVSAIGISQIMPQFAEEFAKKCGFSNFTATDLNDTELNMMIGACQFRSLIDTFDGNSALALVAYNAGKSSISIAQLQSLTNITNIETANYIAKYLYLQQKLKNDPSIADIK